MFWQIYHIRCIVDLLGYALVQDIYSHVHFKQLIFTRFSYNVVWLANYIYSPFLFFNFISVAYRENEIYRLHVRKLASKENIRRSILLHATRKLPVVRSTSLWNKRRKL